MLPDVPSFPSRLSLCACANNVLCAPFTTCIHSVCSHWSTEPHKLALLFRLWLLVSVTRFTRSFQRPCQFWRRLWRSLDHWVSWCWPTLWICYSAFTAHPGKAEPHVNLMCFDSISVHIAFKMIHFAHATVGGVYSRLVDNGLHTYSGVWLL